MTDVRGEVESAADDARDQHGHRLIIVLVGSALACFLLLGGTFLWRTATMQAELDSQSAAITAQNQAGQALKDQVIQLGGVPVTQPPPVTGAVGPQGLQGQKGDKGDQGLPGRDGKDGQSPPCLSTPTQCQGANGKDGAPGTPGADGVDGKDGAPGQPGKDGATGPQGPPGPTCPAGYTLTPVVVLGSDGTTHRGLVCTENMPQTSSTKVRKG